jgi:glycogen(starch) synthase
LTADEAEKILGRRPDVITYNGLNIESIPGIEEVSHSKRRSRLRMLELIMSYFFPNFHFELNETVIFGTFGRYEFHVKGMDVISKALGILNKRLKDENSPKNIVCLYFIPAGVSGIREELLLSKSKLADVKETLENNKDLINFSLLKHLIEGKKLSGHSIFTEDHMNELNSKIKRFNIPIPVLYSTHYLSNYDSDPIINSFKQAELHNNSTDKVRVIFYPLYLNGFDGLLDLEYHEAIQGLDLGLFPSFYEPWGYTPFETASYGVPAITTNVSGFGLFIKSISHENKGIYVIDRRNRSVDEVSQELAEVMHKIIHMSKAERDQLRTVTRALTEKADWKIFANYYFDSHQKALDKTYPK